MAPLPVITNCYRVSLDWKSSVSSQIAENVIHVVAAGSDAPSVATAVDAAFAANQFTCAASTASISTLHVTPLDGSSSTVVHNVTNAHAAGEVTGDWVPNVAAVVSLQTAKRGRSYRGRVYIPFVGEGAVTDGALTSANPPALVTAWDAFRAALVADTMHLVVASYKHSTAENVTSEYVLAACGTQRRRQERVRYP